MHTPLLTLLYALAGGLLAGFSLYIWIRERHAPQARWFVATGVALLAWLVTLFIFNRSLDPKLVLYIGRLNFAVASLAVYAVYRLVHAVVGLRVLPIDHSLKWWTLFLAFVSAFTPLIDKQEIVSVDQVGNHQTIYGAWFPIYALHIVGLLGAAVGTSLRARRLPQQGHIDDQLLLLEWGIFVTGAISLVTNIILPYTIEDFRWIDLGPLSTIFWLLAVAYAVIRHQLFDIRVFIRRAVVLGVALSLVLAAYSALVLLATDWLASSESGGVTRFGVLVLAFSFDPIRRFLEKRIDRLLFPERRRAKSR